MMRLFVVLLTVVLLTIYSLFEALSLLSRVGVGVGVVIPRLKAKSVRLVTRLVNLN